MLNDEKMWGGRHQDHSENEKEMKNDGKNTRKNDIWCKITIREFNWIRKLEVKAQLTGMMQNNCIKETLENRQTLENSKHISFLWSCLPGAFYHSLHRPQNTTQRLRRPAENLFSFYLHVHLCTLSPGADAKLIHLHLLKANLGGRHSWISHQSPHYKGPP